MAERPDLDALSSQIMLYRKYLGHDFSPSEKEILEDFEVVIAYCRELEAELDIYIKADHDGAASLAVDLAEQQNRCRELEAENKQLRTDLETVGFTPENLGKVHDQAKCD